MKFMIQLTGSQREADAMAGKSNGLPTWTKSDVDAMFEHMGALNADLIASGEMVDGNGLAEPKESVRVQKVDGEYVVTENPYDDADNVLAGYWIVDCKDVARAIEIAKRAAACPVPGDGSTGTPFEVRPVGEGPSQE